MVTLVDHHSGMLQAHAAERGKRAENRAWFKKEQNQVTQGDQEPAYFPLWSL